MDNNDRNLVVAILHNEQWVRQVTETLSRQEFGEILDVIGDKLDRPLLKHLWTDVIDVYIESDDPSAEPKHAAVVEKKKGASTQARTELNQRLRPEVLDELLIDTYVPTSLSQRDASPFQPPLVALRQNEVEGAAIAV